MVKNNRATGVLYYTTLGKLDFCLQQKSVLVYRNAHICLPDFWHFFYFPQLLTNSSQSMHSFSIQCLQHFKSNFVITSSLSEAQSSYGCCHFCLCKDFLFPKINAIACVRGCCPYWI